MLTDQLVIKLKAELNVTPTVSQEVLIKNLAEFTISAKGGEVFIVKGYAGTGKTTTLSAYVRMLKKNDLKFVLLAPTGRAAKVFSSYAGNQAYTIHKKIYRQASSKDGFGNFQIDKNLHTRTFFIVDEASMISNQSFSMSAFGTGALLQDLITYVNNENNCNLILIGDTAQLPPVGVLLSPALDSNEMRFFSNSVFEKTLNDVVRQTEDSGILHNATFIRNKIDTNNLELPLFDLADFSDIISLPGNELIECLTESYERCGLEETLVVCRSNKRANKYNQGIRNQILWREEELSPGDLLMVVKNNYFWLKDFEGSDFIANGDIVELVRIRKYKELYGYRFADCTVKLVDYNIEFDALLLLDSLHSETASISSEENKKFYYKVLEDYSDLKPKRKQYDGVKNNEYFNALQVKYANAVTCHKAQGGQWKEVYVDAGYLTEETIDIEYLRWLYTAITRATEKVYLIGFKDEFLGIKKQ
jgi:exodeoxyribonuclease-5